ncbi:M23 family metallopeptidase [Streptomyces sp. NPDC088925]|uniref:M23 family metallopeptidase n=1 Tax=Streptomyces sp. NPDC088925 TaxID=3365914 RepID=UPI003802F3FF
MASNPPAPGPSAFPTGMLTPGGSLPAQPPAPISGAPYGSAVPTQSYGSVPAQSYGSAPAQSYGSSQSYGSAPGLPYGSDAAAAYAPPAGHTAPVDVYPGSAGFGAYGSGAPEAGGEWNPTEDSLGSVRGRHRVAKQRGGLARSSTVLGVGVLAAVGAGGIASAQEKPPVKLSLPEKVTEVTGQLKQVLPDAESLPGIGSLVADAKGDTPQQLAANPAAAPLTNAGLSDTDREQGTTDAGEALRARILAQAENQADSADRTAREQAEAVAAQAAADHAAQAQRKAADEQEKKEAAAKAKAEAEAKAKAEAKRLAELARSYTLPVASYTLTSHFGDGGSMWSSGHHTGLDFAAPTGTPLKAIHSATVQEAGWSGAYGYRTVLLLDDGTELWYCHQSSISVSVGQKVTTGEVIGRVGATGNVTGPHLHLEVHPTGGAAVDPLPWLQDHGQQP